MPDPIVTNTEVTATDVNLKKKTLQESEVWNILTGMFSESKLTSIQFTCNEQLTAITKTWRCAICLPMSSVEHPLKFHTGRVYCWGTFVIVRYSIELHKWIICESTAQSSQLAREVSVPGPPPRATEFPASSKAVARGARPTRRPQGRCRSINKLASRKPITNNEQSPYEMNDYISSDESINITFILIVILMYNSKFHLLLQRLLASPRSTWTYFGMFVICGRRWLNSVWRFRVDSSPQIRTVLNVLSGVGLGQSKTRFRSHHRRADVFKLS